MSTLPNYLIKNIFEIVLSYAFKVNRYVYKKYKTYISCVCKEWYYNILPKLHVQRKYDITNSYSAKEFLRIQHDKEFLRIQHDKEFIYNVSYNIHAFPYEFSSVGSHIQKLEVYNGTVLKDSHLQSVPNLVEIIISDSKNMNLSKATLNNLQSVSIVIHESEVNLQTKLFAFLPSSTVTKLKLTNTNIGNTLLGDIFCIVDMKMLTNLHIASVTIHNSQMFQVLDGLEQLKILTLHQISTHHSSNINEILLKIGKDNRVERLSVWGSPFSIGSFVEFMNVNTSILVFTFNLMNKPPGEVLNFIYNNTMEEINSTYYHCEIIYSLWKKESRLSNLLLILDSKVVKSIKDYHCGNVNNLELTISTSILTSANLLEFVFFDETYFQMTKLRHLTLVIPLATPTLKTMQIVLKIQEHLLNSLKPHEISINGNIYGDRFSNLISVCSGFSFLTSLHFQNIHIYFDLISVIDSILKVEHLIVFKINTIIPARESFNKYLKEISKVITKHKNIETLYIPPPPVEPLKEQYVDEFENSLIRKHNLKDLSLTNSSTIDNLIYKYLY